MAIILPTERSQAEVYLPNFMILYGKPKTGKSSICAALPNCLIIDLEDGYKALSVQKILAFSYNDIMAIRKAIVDKGKEINKKPYKYIVIDNATRLEEYCKPAAAAYYRTYKDPTWGILRDNKGKPIQMEGKYVPDPNADITELAYGRGFELIRSMVKNVIDSMKKVCDCLILVSHTKESSITTETSEMTEISPDLTGKLSKILCGMADAIGYVYRENNETYVSFKGGGITINQARPLHLREQVFTVIKSTEDDPTPVVDIKGIFGEQE